MREFFFKKKDTNEIQGPYGLRQVQNLVSTGELRHENLISEDKQSWTSAAEIDGLSFSEPKKEGFVSKYNKAIGRMEHRVNEMREEAMERRPLCTNCDVRMYQVRRAKHSQVGALIFILAGILCCLLIVGAIVGVPLLVVGLYLGISTEKLWVCPKCRSCIPRM